MSKRQFLCLLGVWVMLFLFLAVPSSWHKVIAVVSGLVILITAYTLPAPTRSGAVPRDSFIDNNNQPQ